MTSTGHVYLVGAGPGDPELLTVRALKLITGMDVVVYDRLVSPEVLALVPAGTSRIYVGKADGRHTLPQSEINALLLKLARSGRQVVRLKGGDPFTFGRGGEEMAFLMRHGVTVEVVPGITSAAGCAAQAGIPLTHRGLATGLRFVTGRLGEEGPMEHDWQSLADPDTTLVVYMGLASVDTFSQSLIEAGLSPHTPVAAVENGTRAQQRVLVTDLARLPGALKCDRFQSPTLLIVGRVAAFAQSMAEEAAYG